MRTTGLLLLLWGAFCQARVCPDPVCPEDDGSNSTTLIASPDCRNFYSCTWGFPTLLACPPGLRFSPTAPGCLPADMVDCSECEEVPAAGAAEVTEANAESDPEATEIIAEEQTDDDTPLFLANYLPFLH